MPVEQRLGQRRAPAGSGRSRGRAAATSARPRSAGPVRRRHRRPGRPRPAVARPAAPAGRARCGAATGRASARSGASVSLVSRPAQTRSHSAATSAGSSVAPTASDERAGRRRRRRRRARRARASCSGVAAASGSGVGQGQRCACRPGAATTQPSSPGSEPSPRPDHLAGGASARRAAPACSPATRAGSTSDSSALTPARRRPAAARPRAARPSAPRSRRADALPGRQEPGERRGRDRLDLAAQRGQRAAAQRAQHLGVAPLRARAAGPELALRRPGRVPRAGASVACDDGDAEPEPGRDVGRVERPVGAGVAGDQVAERVARPARGTPPARRPAAAAPSASRSRPASSIAQPALLAGDPHPDRPPGVLELGQPGRRRAARDRLGGGQRRRARAAGRRRASASRGAPVLGRAAAARPRPAATASASSSSRSSACAEQLGEQRRSRARAPRPGARPAARRPRRGTARRSRTAATARTATAAAVSTSTTRTSRVGDVAHQRDQAGHVEDVLQALAHRLEHDRERRRTRWRPDSSWAARWRCCHSGVRRPRVAPRQQQRAGRALAEPRRRTAPSRRPRR